MIELMYRSQKIRSKRPSYKVFLTGLVGFVTAVYITAVLTWPLQPVMPTSVVSKRTIPASTQPAWPTTYAALGTTDAGLLATSSTEQVPIASITKLITALLILEKKPLKQGEVGPVVPITAADVALYNQYIAADGSVGPVVAGMQITELQLLQGMLLKSANNYADTAATWAYGSHEQYIAAANAYLKKHGFVKTTVVDATGFSPNSKSTPDELVKLGTLAMKEPVLADIVGQKTVVVPGVGTFANTNKLLGTNGIIGLKTGTTDEAGSCLLFASQFVKEGKTTTLIGVVLGAPNHPSLFQSVSNLTGQTTTQFANRALVKSGEIYATYRTPWGATSHAVSPPVTTFTWEGAPSAITATPATIDPGGTTAAGSITISVGSKAIQKELALEKPLKKPSALWRVTHPKYIFNL